MPSPRRLKVGGRVRRRPSPRGVYAAHGMFRRFMTLALVSILSRVAAGQSDLKAALVEIDAIHKDLASAIRSFEEPPNIGDSIVPDYESSMERLSQMAARIDLFELRFGARPEAMEGWKRIQSTARNALAPRRRGPQAGEIHFVVSSSGIGRAILQEIAGDLEEAQKTLDGIKAGGGCGNWIATVALAVNTRRSAILERQGEYTKALTVHEVAVGDVKWSLHSKNLPALYVRYGALLEKCGREPRPQYQRVVDLFPGTEAEVIARARLSSTGNLAQPNADRLKTYLDTDDRGEAIRAFGTYRFPESFDILRGMVKREDWIEDEVLDAFETLGDRRAIEVLKPRIAKTHVAQVVRLLVVLGHLGDTSQIVPGLERLAAFAILGGKDLQDFLLSVYPRGPRFDERELGYVEQPSRFVGPWIEYIKRHPTASRPTPRPSR
jgi:hypothetical protein